MTEENLTRLSLSDLKNRKGRTRRDAPSGEELGPDFWEKAQIVEPESKRSVHLRLDADVFDYFKSQGKGHLTRMTAVLRAYVDAHKSQQ